MISGLSLTTYEDFQKQNPPLPESHPGVAQLKKVGPRIAEAVEKFLNDNKLS